MSAFHHEPVMSAEVVAALAPRDGAVLVDCTVGGGGHSFALLSAADCRVIGLDRDTAAIEAARERCAFAGERFEAVHAPFSALGRVLDERSIDKVDGVLADLGVSSHQLDTAERGFSFQRSGPLDMRMDPSAERTAAELVNGWSEADLADVIFRYGEERRARRVAAAIVAGRPWSDTRALAVAVAKSVGGPRGRIHPATRTFQALRIVVNRELEELESLIPQALSRLAPGGRLAVITFHSLEDRIVKRALADASGRNRPRDAFGNLVGPVLVEAFRSQVPAQDDPNPRARSARLRVAERLP